MPTIYASDVGGLDANAGTAAAPVKTLVRAQALAVAGDTIIVAAGVYRETVSFGKSGLTFKNAAGARPILDGEGVRANGFASTASWSRLRIEGFEVRNFTSAGISLDSVQGVASNNVITGNVVHHIVNNVGFFQYGIRIANGNPLITNNVVHHIGHGGEAMGIWLFQCNNHVVDGNVIYMIRKGGIRDANGLSGRIVNNRLFMCWAGLEPNGCTATLFANNIIAFCLIGVYPKHCGTKKYVWGLTDATLPNWVRVWHNTIYSCRWAGMVLATNTPLLDKVDIRNNLFAGFGRHNIQDTPSARTANMIVDFNVYAPLGGAAGAVTQYRTGIANPGVEKTLDEVRISPGWDLSSQQIDPLLPDPEKGLFDYPLSSPAAGVGDVLASSWGSQLGARGLPLPPASWTRKHLNAVSRSWTSGVPGAQMNELYDYGSSVWANTGNDRMVGDLGSEQTISHVYQDPYTHNALLNVKGYRVEVGPSAAGPWDVVAESDYADKQGATYWTELAQPAQGRYVRYTTLSNFGDTYTGTVEVGVGYLSGSLPPSGGGGGGGGVIDPPPPPGDGGPGGTPPLVTTGGYWGARLRLPS